LGWLSEDEMGTSPKMGGYLMSPKNEGVARKIADLGIQDWEIPELSGLWQ
jgi:hypothetical protein